MTAFPNHRFKLAWRWRIKQEKKLSKAKREQRSAIVKQRRKGKVRNPSEQNAATR